MMYIRLLILTILFAQCSSPIKMSKKQLSEAPASFMRYIPGAGGGKGITFKVPFKSPSSDFAIERFVVNNIELPAVLEDSTIVASVFYAEAEPTMDNPNPDPINPVLFNAETFQATIYFSLQGVSDSVFIKNFIEEEQPFYP